MAKDLQPVPWGEISYTPDDDLNIIEDETYREYSYGFRVGVAGDVHFEYADGHEFTRTYNAGDEVFGRISKIHATGTDATSITLFSFLE